MYLKGETGLENWPNKPEQAVWHPFRDFAGTFNRSNVSLSSSPQCSQLVQRRIIISDIWINTMEYVMCVHAITKIKMWTWWMAAASNKEVNPSGHVSGTAPPNNWRAWCVPLEVDIAFNSMRCELWEAVEEEGVVVVAASVLVDDDALDECESRPRAMQRSSGTPTSRLCGIHADVRSSWKTTRRS